MAFNVYDILGAVNAVNGLTKSSKFFVEISPPSAFPVDYNLFFLCEAATLPGITWQTDDIKMFGYGNVEKRAYAPVFQDVNLTFFNDGNGSVLRFFHKWMQAVYNFNQSTNPNATSSRGQPLSTFGYPKEYYGVVNITHFDDAGEQVVSYTLNDAYPISIGDVSVDWNLSDQLMRIPVSFAYTYWTSETLDQGIVDYRSEAVYNATQSTAARVDFENKAIWELLNFTSPAIVQNRVNVLANLLTFL